MVAYKVHGHHRETLQRFLDQIWRIKQTMFAVTTHVSSLFLWRGIILSVCSGSWSSIRGKGGSSRVREKKSSDSATRVPWSGQWINRRDTQIDTSSYPKQLHPPPSLMLPRDTFSLPLMTPFQALQLSSHFNTSCTSAVLHQIITLSLYGEYGMSLLAKYKEKCYWCKQDKVVT